MNRTKIERLLIGSLVISLITVFLINQYIESKIPKYPLIFPGELNSVINELQGYHWEQKKITEKYIKLSKDNDNCFVFFKGTQATNVTIELSNPTQEIYNSCVKSLDDEGYQNIYNYDNSEFYYKNKRTVMIWKAKEILTLTFKN